MAETEIADADTLRDLREIALKAYLAHPQAKGEGCMVDPMEAAVIAVLMAAKPEPLHVPVDVDGLARTIRDAYYCAGKGWAGLARAALAFLNIEPCAKPEYNPDDVALTANERAELENLRVECKRLRQWQVRVQQAINLPEVPK